MKQERGITTASVIVYIIAILFVISALSVISGYFTKQITSILKKSESSKTYITFMSYFTQDIQEKGNSIEEVNTQTIQENGNSYQNYYIAFSNGSQYVYSSQNRSIYKNDVKICENVDSCVFYKSAYGTNKTLVKIDFKTGDFDKTGSNALKFYM